jgi:glycosyltransferase involved in cell wall biosynthesis
VSAIIFLALKLIPYSAHKFLKLFLKALIQERLAFARQIRPNALAPELACSDLALLPHHTETFGLSIAEAQACRPPVVSYRIRAIPEVLLNGHASLLADSFDQGQLTEAAIQLIRGPEIAREMEMGRAGQNRSRTLRLEANGPGTVDEPSPGPFSTPLWPAKP